MSRKFIFVYNPISGTQEKARVIEALTQEMERRKLSFSFLESNAENDYEFLKIRIAEEEITDIIIIGGDGTVNQLAGALQDVGVNFGIIPMGSGNGLALAAGIPKNHRKALKIILDGKAQHIDAFLVNELFSCMLCGLGLDAKVAHDFADSKTRGLLTYVKISIRNFLQAPTYSFRLELNDTTILAQAYFISIANSNQFGNHVTIAPEAELSDGKLDVIIVNKMNKFKLVGNFVYQVLFGKVDEATQKHKGKNDIQYFQTAAIGIDNKDGAPLHIDGDAVDTATQISIKIIPKAFRLWMPR